MTDEQANAKEWKRYEVAKYVRGRDAKLDVVAPKVPDTFDMEGSIKEKNAGGKRLECRIDLEEGVFVVYLPPEDRNWGSKSHIRTPGYRPSQEVAQEEFSRWVDRFGRPDD